MPLRRMTRIHTSILGLVLILGILSVYGGGHALFGADRHDGHDHQITTLLLRYNHGPTDGGDRGEPERNDHGDHSEEECLPCSISGLLPVEFFGELTIAIGVESFDDIRDSFARYDRGISTPSTSIRGPPETPPTV